MDTPLVDRLRRLAAELSGIADHVTTPAPSSDDATTHAERLANRFLDAVERGDLGELDELVHHDVVHVVPGRSRAAGVYEGPDAIRQAMSVLPRAGVHDLQAKLVDLVATPTQVVTFHELRGTVDGQPRTIELMLRFSLRDGRIARISEYTADQYTTDEIFRGSLVDAARSHATPRCSPPSSQARPGRCGDAPCTPHPRRARRRDHAHRCDRHGPGRPPRPRRSRRCGDLDDR